MGTNKIFYADKENETKKLYRYKKGYYYFYTTNPYEIITDRDRYEFDHDVGYVYSTQVPGTEPLYRSLNGSAFPDHKLSRIRKDANDVILGYVFPVQQPTTKPLYSIKAGFDCFPSVTHYLYTTVPLSTPFPTVVVGYVLAK